MATRKLSGKDLRKLGFPEGRAIGEAIKAMDEHYKGKSILHKKAMLKKVVENPGLYLKHEAWGPVAMALIIKTEHNETLALREKRIPYHIYGADGIEQGAINQMEIAMKLPVTKYGALMPDAHQGYGLPIGGVLATENAVIPYGVGVDIGCRMCMTMYDIPPAFVHQNTEALKDMLMENTKFGQAVFKRPKDHEVLDRGLFNEINILKSLTSCSRRLCFSSGYAEPIPRNS